MPDPAAYLFLPEGMADWEPGHVVAGLHRWGGVPIRTVGFTEAPITTMGGLRVVPDIPLAELPTGADAVRLLILPGSDLWEGDYPSRSLEPALHALEASGVPIAAICGATIAVARAGLLRGRRHTSNGPDYLAGFAPGTTDAADYVEELAVRDRGVITASGIGPVEFAHEIFVELGVFSAAELEEYLELYGRRAPQA